MSLLQVKYLLNRIAKKDTKEVERAILAKDPLNHFVRFERYLALGESAGPGLFASYIQNEFPEQTYLELALWYYALNRPDEALKILNLAPGYNLIAYWKAFLLRDTPRFEEELSRANAGTAGMVFPFRDEDVPTLEWIITRTDDWKPRYYLGILQASRQHMAAAREPLLSLSDTIRFAPLYVFRSDYQDSPVKAIEDLERALRIDPSEWRTVDKLAKRLRDQKELARAQSVVMRYLENYPDN